MKHLLIALSLLTAQLANAAVLDDMKDAALWKATASDQVKASARRDVKDDSLCLDYDFAGVSGYAVLRRELPIDWPADFALTTQLKGDAKGNDVQIKFVDASGDNVWWIHRPALALPDTLTETRFKRRHVAFAWGPTEDRQLKRTQHIEFVVVAGSEIEVQLLRHLHRRPRRPGEGGHRLEAQQATAVGTEQHDEARILCAVTRLVAGEVFEAEEGAVELRGPSGVRGVEDQLPEAGRRHSPRVGASGRGPPRADEPDREGTTICVVVSRQARGGRP